MAPLKLFVFGPPRLERDGRAIDLNLPKALALLVYLVVTTRPQSRDTLAALLWPESDQREARASLRRILHRLREALGDDLLVVDADIIRLIPMPSSGWMLPPSESTWSQGSHAPVRETAWMQTSWRS